MEEIHKVTKRKTNDDIIITKQGMEKEFASSSEFLYKNRVILYH